MRENPNGGGFQVFESTKFFEFTNATEFLFEWVNNVGNSVNQGPLYEEAQDYGGGVVYGWGVRAPLQNQMFQTDVRRVYAAKLLEALPLEYTEFLVLVVDSHGTLRATFVEGTEAWYTTSTTVTLVSSGVSFLPGGVSICAVSAASVLVAVSFSTPQKAKLMYVWIDRDNRGLSPDRRPAIKINSVIELPEEARSVSIASVPQGWLYAYTSSSAQALHVVAGVFAYCHKNSCQGGALASAAQAMNPATAGRVSQLVMSTKSSATKTPLVPAASSLSLCVFADLVVITFIAKSSPSLNSDWAIRPSSPDFNPLLKVTKKDRSHFNVTSNPLLLANTTVHTQVVDTRPLYTAWSSVQQGRVTDEKILSGAFDFENRDFGDLIVSIESSSGISHNLPCSSVKCAASSSFYGVVGGLFAVCAFETDWQLQNSTLVEIPSSAALVFTPFVMDQMQQMSQMTAGAASCPYTQPPLGSENDVLYYATAATAANPDRVYNRPARAAGCYFIPEFATSTLIDSGSRFIAAMSNERIGVFQSKLSAMMEEVPNPRNGFTLTATSALADVSLADVSSASATVMAITDIYIVDTLPPQPFDPSILAAEMSMKRRLKRIKPSVMPFMYREVAPPNLESLHYMSILQPVMLTSCINATSGGALDMHHYPKFDCSKRTATLQIDPYALSCTGSWQSTFIAITSCNQIKEQMLAWCSDNDITCRLRSDPLPTNKTLLKQILSKQESTTQVEMIARHAVSYYHYTLNFKLLMDSKLQCLIEWSVRPTMLHSPVSMGAGYCILNQMLRTLQAFDAGKFQLSESVLDSKCVQKALAPCVKSLSKYDAVLQ